MPEHVIHKFGSDIVQGMPDNQEIEKTVTIYEGITILAEHVPMGTQSLRTEDIIEELNKIPENIRKFISSVLLSPYECPDNAFWKKWWEDNAEIVLASANKETRQITIFAVPKIREFMKQVISRQLTLQHEAGHIIDGSTESTTFNSFSEDHPWELAMFHDSEIKRAGTKFPKYYISQQAEKTRLHREDFAYSVSYFSQEAGKKWMKENYPNRYEVLVKILGDY